MTQHKISLRTTFFEQVSRWLGRENTPFIMWGRNAMSWGMLSVLLVVNPTLADDNFTSLNDKLLVVDSIRSSDPQRFSRLLTELTDSKQLLSAQQQHYLDFLAAYQMTYQDKLDVALTAANNILNSSASDLLKFRTNLLIINIHAIAQNWSEGLAILSNVINELPQITDEAIYQSGLAAAAILYTRLGQYQIGYNYAHKLKERALDGRNRCLANKLIVNNKFKLGHLDTLSDEISLAIYSCEKVDEKWMVVAIRSYVATQLIDDGNFAQARDYLLKHLPLAEHVGYPRILAIYYSLLAKASYFENDIVQAKAFGLQTIKVLETTVSTESALIAYKVLYQIAQQQHDYQSALEYLELYSKVNITYLDEVKAESMAFQLAKHKAVTQRNEVEFFKRQNELLKSEKLLAISDTDNDRLFIILLGLIVTLLVFLVFKSRGVKERLTVMAQYDDLTRVFSRGHFIDVANSALQYCKNTDQQLSCIVFDLDWFKSINDTHGHGCGDWALKEVVEQCRLVVRNNDIFARIGGEEFCIVLPGCSLELATTLAERCRQAVCDIDTSESGATFELSASFGVTDISLSGLTLEKLMMDADKAMYQSKKAGRNCVTEFKGASSRPVKTQQSVIPTA